VASPVIGVTAYVERARWGAWDVPAVLVPYDYVRMLEAAGARPLVVPPSTDAVEETLDVLDGLLISGGPDLDPALYGADAHEATDEPRTARDAGELALLTAALERDLPVLAVCRGSQLLNVARGGDLVQHLPETIGHEGHKHEPGTFSEHGVEVKAGTRLGSLVGGHAPVHSHHHQGFGRVGEGLVETAWADDGSLEGIEDPTRRFALGVLWHPEAGEDTALFEALVEEARRYRARRSAA
jgi:putative glutamine amidotransferase